MKQSEIAKEKVSNIIYMAIGFSAMTRVFKSGSKEKLIPKVEELIIGLKGLKRKEDFDRLHDSFCQWGQENIKSSKHSKLNTKNLKKASYGQIAKTLNVLLKVIVYYCDLPSEPKARHIVPWLHPAIDNPMTKYLRNQFPKEVPKRLHSIAMVNKNKYKILLQLVCRDIQECFNGEIHPIQWEDHIWRISNAK